MDDPKQNVVARTTSESPLPPIQGRPAGTGHTPVSRSTSSAQQAAGEAPGETPHEESLAGRPGSARPHASANAAAQASEDAAPEPQAKSAPKPAWRAALSAIGNARWVLAIPAFIIALYAEQLVEQARNGVNRLLLPPALAWQLFAVAAILLVIATFPSKALLPAGPSAFLRSLRQMKYKWLFLSLLGSAVAAGAIAFPLFWKLNQARQPQELARLAQNWTVNTGSWVLYILSLVLFGLAFVVWERSVTPPAEGTDANPPLDRLPRLLEWLVMLCIFGAALYLRMNNLDNVPPGLWFDEAQNGVVGRGLVAPGAAHLTFIQDFTQMGALFFYFDGLMVKFFGNNIWVVRFLPALAGSLISVLLYVLGSRLYGWRVGLAAGALLAVSSWNIDFSRLGMASMPTVALDVAVFLCTAQALRTGRLGYYAAAGVLLGLSLQIYYVSRLVPLILLAILVHRLITQHIKLIRSIRAGLVVFAVGALLAFLPVGLFAIEQPDAYNGRTDTVSIFNPANNGGNLQAALQSNIQKHLLMFNWLGDGNGRHNLPGSPMLDWITAALFFAGLGACVLRFWRWQYVFPIAWFVAAMSGGALSLPFEAPQSHRSLEASVVTALLAGIFVGEVWTLLAGADMVRRLANAFSWLRDRAGRVRIKRTTALKWPMRAAWIVSMATLLVVFWLAGSLDYHKYFEVQARDMGVWKDMYAPQAHAARVSIRYGADHDVYMAPILKGLPPSVYLAPNVQTLNWPGMQALPLTSDKPGGVVIILDLPSAADVAMIARYYPHAKFELFTSPSSPEVLIYTITVPADDIKALQGVHVTAALPGSDPATKTGKTVPEFTNDASKLGLSSVPVRLSATLRVDAYGKYNFGWQSPGGRPGSGQLTVDGYTLSAGQALTMGTGLHSVSVTDEAKNGADASQLMWGLAGSQLQPVPPGNLFDATKVEPHGLTATFTPGLNPDAPPTLGRVDPAISFNFHETPLPRPYTAVWKGKLYIPQDGTYTLGTEQLSSSKLFFDGQEIIANNSINNLMEHPMNLSKGFHDIELVYSDQDNYSHMYLYWTPPGRSHSIIPSVFLWPQMGQYPQQSEAGNWPTLDEADGTQLPPDRVSYYPPRNPNQPQEPAESAPPPPPPPASSSSPPPPNGKELKPLFTIGDQGPTIGKPRAATVDGAGNIYIFTEVDSKIHKFDPKGNELTSWYVHDAGGKPLVEASALVVKDNNIMLFDSNTSSMLVYSPDGKESGRVLMCACFFARGASLARDGNLWIANTGGSQVLKISPTGQQLEALGDKGSEPGKFIEPASVWEAQDGTLYVADVGNKRVQSFTPNHKPLAQWDMGQSVARDGNRLVGDSQGNVIVTELVGTAIVKYDKQGKELGRWYYSRGGSALVPAGIAALGDDKFIVLFQEGNLAAVFSLK